MRSKVQAAIAFVMGAIGFFRWLKADAAGAGSYATGHSSGLLAGSLVFLAAGLYFFFRKD